MCARTVRLCLLLTIVLIWSSTVHAQSEAPLYPLWPEVRIAMNQPEVRRLYQEVIKPFSSRQAPFFGSPSRCETGVMEPGWVLQQEQLLNAYRTLAGAGSVRFDAAMNNKAVKGALITAANHFPPEHYPKPGARCYSAEGAEVTASSNLAYGAIKTAMSDWVSDNGVVGVGHRMVALHPAYREMGLGAVGAGMVLQVPDSSPVPAQSRIAVWPPAGFIPAKLVFETPSFTFSLHPALKPGHTLVMKGAKAQVMVNGWPRPTVTYPDMPYGSLQFEVGYGDKAVLKKQLQDQGYIAIDVIVTPVTVNGVPAEIRYRTVYFNPDATTLPEIVMPPPGFYRINSR